MQIDDSIDTTRQLCAYFNIRSCFVVVTNLCRAYNTVLMLLLLVT